MNRKPLIITISIALTIIIGAVLVWFFLFRTPTNPTLSPVPGGLPFGQGGGGDVSFGLQGTAPAGTGLDENGRPKEKLFRLVDTPVAGAVAFLKNGSTMVRYVDRATGHIYDINPITLEKTKITNNTLPKIYEAYFKNDASSVVFRSLEDDEDTQVNTVLDLIPPVASSSTSTSTLSTSSGQADNLYTIRTSLLRPDISELSVLSDNSLVYTTQSSGEVIHANFTGGNASRLFASAFTDWRLLAPSISNIFVYTKASSGISGYAYKIVGGSLSKILGPLDSLVLTSSPDGKHIAYSYTSSGESKIQTTNLETKKVYDLFPVTLAEKCVWSKLSANILYCATPEGGVGTSEPDSWYQGSTHFSDRLWRFDTGTGLTDLLSEPKNDYNIDIDAENLTLSPDEDYLIFMNKNDLTLWALNLK